ncbi:MAG: hypothetical protein ACPG4U_13140, partial [Pseudomonadales bacterium]
FLHWVFAYQNGLAINYKNGLNSIRYKDNPKAFIDRIIATISTRNAADVSYTVDLNQANSLDGGLIYNYAGEPGHALYLLDMRGNGLYDRLEGPFPAQHANLQRSLFSDAQLIEGATLRRMFMYRRVGNRIEAISAPQYSADRSQALTHYFQGDTPLWQALRQRYLAAAGKALETSELAPVLQELACDRVEKRIHKVNAGLRNCARQVEVDATQCTAARSGAFSTPGFDARFAEITAFQADNRIQLAPRVYCSTFDFAAQLPGEPPLLRRFALTDSEGRLSDFFHRAVQDADMSDPNATLSARWGCDSPVLECLGPRDTAEQASMPQVQLEVTQSAQALHFKIAAARDEEVRFIIVERERSGLRQVLHVASEPLSVPRQFNGEMLSIYLANHLQDKLGSEVLVVD